MANITLPAGQLGGLRRGSGTGILLMLLAVMFIALIDPAAKYAGRQLPVLEVIWGRYAFALLTMIALFRPRLNPKSWGVQRLGLQMLRACLLLSSTAFNFLALRSLGLVENQAIVMLGPVVITGLSIVLFREKVRAMIAMGLVVGLCGALVVIRPGGEVFKIASLYALGNVFSYAFYVLLSKRLLRTESALSLNILAVLIPTIILSVLVIPVWQWPQDGYGWLALVLVGVIGGLGHFFLVTAHQYALASTLAPLSYTQLCWALIGGLLIFGELPDIATALGALTIVGSGVLIALGNRRRMAR
ncbi:MAG: DMT family transporter [Rhizobium sp.]